MPKIYEKEALRSQQFLDDNEPQTKDAKAIHSSRAHK